MQNVDGFVDVNKNCNRYKEISEFLKDLEHLFKWKQQEDILDAGCGPGDITANVLQQWVPSDFRSLVGVDVSQKMIKHANRTYGSEKIAFYTADIASDMTKILQNEQYSEGFDKLFSFCVLHWLYDLEKGIANLHRLLKPNGQALLTFPVDRYFQKTFKKIRSEEKWTGFFKYVSRDLPPSLATGNPCREFQGMLTTAGFHVVKCEVQDSYTKYASLDAIKGLILSLDQDINCVPEELRNQYLEDCLQIMEDMGAVNVQNVTVKQTMLTSFATKLSSS